MLTISVHLSEFFVNKIELLAHCKSQIEDAIHSIISSMQDLVSEAENDSKSSAGDKHETGRAMMQLAQEQLSKQLLDAEFKLNTLNRIDLSSQHTIVSEGSLVYTDEAIYFISAPIGKIQFEGMDVFVISSQSPLGKALIGKNAGESLILHNRTICISRIS